MDCCQSPDDWGATAEGVAGVMLLAVTSWNGARSANRGRPATLALADPALCGGLGNIRGPLHRLRVSPAIPPCCRRASNLPSNRREWFLN
jgi:hypothetical protein